MVYSYNINEIDDVLIDMELGFDATELHGMMCGFLCYRKASDKSWKKLIFEDFKVPPEFQVLLDESEQAMNDEDFQFEMLLPDEEENIVAQAEALSFWCRGLTTMWGLLKVDIDNSETVKEALQDIIEITKLDFSELSDTDENEQMLTEVHEYVRAAVLLIHAENEIKKTVH